ncbi:MAG: N-formylglutamate amidohydrolase [Gammaproteobacteria bacterium]|nr:N-formylglutamate amidohydrolase [Gammaproteobacteria bacterium]
MVEALLSPGEPEPVEQIRMQGRSVFVLTCDHAGNLIPRRLAGLGLSETDRRRHIAWDIGAAGVSRRMSEVLDAPLIMQRYSRLVVDCNRRPHAEDFITTLSESTPIPGNLDLDPAQRRAREAEVFEPYHAAITALLDERRSADRTTAFVAVHSCTPVYHGVSRPWHVGVLYDRDDRLAQLVLQCLRREDQLVVGENQPYFLTHERDYSVPVHAEDRGLLHIEFEVRQDLIEHPRGQVEWGERLARALLEAAPQMGLTP